MHAGQMANLEAAHKEPCLVPMAELRPLFLPCVLLLARGGIEVLGSEDSK